MVGKIIKGSSSGQCAGYCLNHDNAEILCWQGLDIDFIQAETLASSEGRERLTLAREMALNISRSFDEQASLNPAVDKPVGHIPLCFMKDDAPLLDNERMRRIAEEYLRLMEYGDTQYMVVRHDNSKGNPHVHIFFNRVDNNGKCLSAWQDFRRNAEVCRKLTVKYGLNMAKNRSNTIVNDLHGRERVRYQISNAIDAALPHCRDWNTLGRTLLQQDITMELVRRNNGEIQGVKFGKRSDSDGHWYEFGGSKIGRKYSFANIGRALETGESLDEAQQHRDESERQGHNASHSEAITAAIGILTSGFCDTAPQVDDAERRRKKELEKKKRGIHR